MRQEKGDRQNRHDRADTDHREASGARVGRSSAAQAMSLRVSHAAANPSAPWTARRSAMAAWSDLDGGCREGERGLAEPELEQPVAAPRLAVIVALRRRARDDLDLAIVEAKLAIDRRDLRLDRALVRQEQPRRTALDQRSGNGAARDIRKRLGREHHGGVLLAQGFQPLAQLLGKAGIVQGQPALVDDEQRRRAGEPPFDAVEQIGRGSPAPRRSRSGLRSRTPARRPRPTARPRRQAAGRTDRRGNRAATPASARSIAAIRRVPSACVRRMGPRQASSALSTNAPWLPA